MLERMRFAAMQTFPQRVFEATIDRSFMEFASASIVARLTTEILGERTGAGEHVVAFDYPATWWEHLKRDHLPSWFTRRRPVRYRTYRKVVKWTQMATFPHSPIRTPPDARGPIVVARWTGHDGEQEPA